MLRSVGLGSFKSNKIFFYLVSLRDRLLRGWITKKHQFFFKYKFVTVILLGTMFESFKKIVRIVFELRALMWGWQGCGTYASFFFLVLIYRYPFLKMKKIKRTVPILKSNSTYFSLKVFFYGGKCIFF